jgi:hypothetical protein
VASPTADLKIHRQGLFAFGMSLLIIVAGVFLLPIALPQETCDAFGSWMACSDGSAPRCMNVSAPGGRRNEKELSVMCPAGPGSSAPMFLSAGAVSAIVAAISAVLVVRSLMPRVPRA